MQGTRTRDEDDVRLGIGRWIFDDDLIATAAAEGRARVRASAWPPASWMALQDAPRATAAPAAPAALSGVETPSAQAAPPVAVVIGRGGQPELEVDVDAARADGVPILRRRGGGCAVLLDPGNVIVSVVLPAPGVGGITSAFARISAAVIDALARVGVPGVERRGTSDLALADRKVGGACIWRTRGLVYYSTTLLVCPDLDLVERYLPHPPREPGWRRGRPHREFMGSLAHAGYAADARGLAGRLGEELEKGSRSLADQAG